MAKRSSRHRSIGTSRIRRPTDTFKPRLKPAEQLLLQAADEINGSQIIMTTVGSAQAAAAVARRHPQAQVDCYFLDVFLADAAREQHADVLNLHIRCEPDFAVTPADAVGLTLPARGESELARDLIQAAHQRLVAEGRLFVATDNPKDHWLNEHLQDFFAKIACQDHRGGRLYVAWRPKPVKKLKQYGCWFAFRGGQRLIYAYSRPGVFSHRHLDVGARALIESLTVPEGRYAGEAVSTGSRVLDLGCGSGAVGFAAALRAADVAVHAVDANVRAIECTRLGAERNQLQNLTTQLSADGECDAPASYDLVLANPPYFSNYRIAEVFLKAALSALRPRGRAHFVTKQPQWFADKFAHHFDEVSVREIRGYYIVKGTQRPAAMQH